MKALNKSAALMIAAGAIVACLVFLFGGITLHKTTMQQNKTYTGTCEAVVIDYEVRQEETTSTDSDGVDTTDIIDMYFPIFQYTVDGEEYTVVSDSGSSDPAYEVNSTLAINYLPSDPSRFFVSGDKFRNMLPYVLYAASLVAALLGVSMFLRARKM